MKTRMQIDPYTKIILTIIALCLVWICLREVKIVPALYAANSDMVDVRIKAIEKSAGQSWDPLLMEALDNLAVEVKNVDAVPVMVKNALLAVDVKNVNVKTSLVPIKVKK